MGRVFRPEDALNGAAPVILISDAWWKTQFNADPNIVGKAFDMNGTQTTVIGVLPRSFDFGAVFSPGAKVDAITPLNLYGPPRNWGNIITMIGRLKPGVSLAQAQDDAAAAAPHMCWNNNHPNTCGSYADTMAKAVVPVPLKDYVSGKLRRSLVVLWSAVGMILLIACVNLSNLLLARAAARSKEFAMRGALGASRMPHRPPAPHRKPHALRLPAPSVGLGLAWILVSWLAHQGAIALPLLSTLAHRRRGPRLDAAHRRHSPPSSSASSPASAWPAAICRNRSKTPAPAPDKAANTTASAPSSSSPR